MPGDPQADPGDEPLERAGAAVDRGAAGDQELYAAVERAILAAPRSLTRSQVAEAADVPLDRAMELWRALGFSGADDEEAMFVEADVEALRLVSWLVDQGFVDPQVELALVRSMGRTFSRLADWEVGELAVHALASAEAVDSVEDLLTRLLPVVEDVQNYVWRRHLAAAAGRRLLRPQEEEGAVMSVGFADIVGFTRRSRDLDPPALAELIETFEGTSASIVHERGGRIIKTIGDEVLFVVDDPVAAAEIAVELVEAEGDGFPQLRVGAAHGRVLTRLGDVFGPVVNIAARLTSLARPGRVLLDRELAARLQEADHAGLRVRRARTATVRGYSRLETWSLRRARG